MDKGGPLFSDHNGSFDSGNISATLRECSPDYQIYATTFAATEILQVIVILPTSVIVLCKIIKRWRQIGHRAQGRSSSIFSSADLITINLSVIAMMNAIAGFVHGLNSLPTDSVLPTVLETVFGTVPLVAGPFLILGLCLDSFLAVVYPLKYTYLNKTWKLPLLITASTWLYGTITEILLIARQVSPNSGVHLISFYITIPLTLILNISTLHVLRLAGLGCQRLSDLSPIKRRAFWVVLLILGFSLAYCFPRLLLFTYMSTTKSNHMRVKCLVTPVVMIVPTFLSSLSNMLFVYFQTPVKLCQVKH